MKKLLVLLGMMALVACAHGSPTPVDQRLIWDDYTDPDGVGYFLYWDRGAAPGTYVDSRKIDLGMVDPETINIAAVMGPLAHGPMCFRMTAYDLAGNESAYSNEDCGFLGFGNPQNLRFQ